MYLWRYILQILMSDFILGKACVHVCTFFVCLGTHVCASSSVYMCAHVYTCSGSQWTTFEAFSTLPTFVFSRQGLSQLIWSLASKFQRPACGFLSSASATGVNCHNWLLCRSWGWNSVLQACRLFTHWLSPLPHRHLLWLLPPSLYPCISPLGQHGPVPTVHAYLWLSLGKYKGSH